LQPGNFFRGLVIQGPDKVSFRRTGGRKQTFELHIGEDIGRAGIPVDVVLCRIKGTASFGQDNRTDLEVHGLGLLCVINGLLRADLGAIPAFALGQVDALAFINDIFERNCLGVFEIDGLAFGKPTVIFVRDFLGAFLSTQAAGNAFVRVHIAGVLEDAHLKISFFAVNGCDFGEGEQFDVDVPADLDQLGGDNSHGAVIGGECLVQLRHHPANGTGSLHEVDIVS